MQSVLRLRARNLTLYNTEFEHMGAARSHENVNQKPSYENAWLRWRPMISQNTFSGPESVLVLTKPKWLCPWSMAAAWYPICEIRASMACGIRAWWNLGWRAWTSSSKYVSTDVYTTGCVGITGGSMISGSAAREAIVLCTTTADQAEWVGEWQGTVWVTKSYSIVVIFQRIKLSGRRIKENCGETIRFRLQVSLRAVMVSPMPAK